MIKLVKTLNSWGAPAFNDVMKLEVEHLDAQLLPLQQGLTRGGSVADSKFNAMILGVSEESDIVRAKAGIFYTSVIAGCNCADDPTPVDEQAEYCEVQFTINKQTAETTVSLLA